MEVNIDNSIREVQEYLFFFLLLPLMTLPSFGAFIWRYLRKKSHSSTLAWKIHEQRSLVGCSPWGH